MNRSTLALLCCVLALVAGCGRKADAPAKAREDAAPAAAPLAMPALGVDQIRRFNFVYEAGSPAYDKAVAAYRKKDWPAVRQAFILSQLEGLTYAQIAARLQVTVRTVNNYMLKALEHCYLIVADGA